MIQRLDCGTLPWISASVGIAGVAAGFFIPSPSSWLLSAAWYIYLFFIVISGFLLLIAYWGWQCHRERLRASLPSVPIRQILHHLATTGGWIGTPSEFNRHASQLLHGTEFSSFINEPTDYYSNLISDDFIFITSITDGGDLANGTADVEVAVELTEKAHRVLSIAEKFRGQ